MLEIEKLIIETNFQSKDKEYLLEKVRNVSSQKTINTPNSIVADIAKSFANKHPSLIESSGIIPEILQQQNFKTINFLIDTSVYGVYFNLSFIILFGWVWPSYFLFLDLMSYFPIDWKTYSLFLILGAQILYYRFLWTRLMP